MSTYGHAQVNAPLLGASATNGPPPVHAAWESARKRSRQLETALYKKLQEFAQVQTLLMNEAAQGRRGSSSRQQHMQQLDLELGRTGSSAAASSSTATAASSSSSSLAGLTPLLQYESLTGELEQLLSSFASTLDAMSKMLSDAASGVDGSGGTSLNSDANQYVLSKQRSILHDNTQEFRRTRQNITAALARQELMSGAASRSADAAERGRTEQLLREGKSLQNSLNRADDVIAQAVSARDSLLSQGSVFSGVRGKMGQLGALFPVVGKLVGKINVSKQRDMLVLACVIATCMFFTMIYIMSKP